jgi:hypothetical protein
VSFENNLLMKELNAAHATRLRLHQDKELNVTAKLTQAAKHNDHQLYVVSKILGARYNELDVFHELSVAWRSIPFGRVLCAAKDETSVEFMG